MSTRSNIVLNYGENEINIYRHWDGYLAMTGYDLLCHLLHSKLNPNKFLTKLLNSKNSPSTIREADNQYELTSGIHGDSEYLYEIDFIMIDMTVKSINLKISNRVYGDNWEILHHLKNIKFDELYKKTKFINDSHLKMLKAS